MKYSFTLFSLFIPLFFNSCSNQQLYQAIQENQRRECELLPYPRRNQCEAQYDKSYEQYEQEREQREREAILKD